MPGRGVVKDLTISNIKQEIEEFAVHKYSHSDKIAYLLDYGIHWIFYQDYKYISRCFITRMYEYVCKVEFVAFSMLVRVPVTLCFSEQSS